MFSIDGDGSDGHPVKASIASDTRKSVIHHEAETHEKTITKHVCKKCGHVKED